MIRPPPIPHVMTIDLEDWFHCLEPDPAQWTRFPRRVEIGTGRLLELLEANGSRATFFVLGDVARHAPDLIREVAARGHEVGAHGMTHQMVYSQTPHGFRDDLRHVRDLLASLTGTPPCSYRAPYFSITPKSLWALDVLREEGFRHDSSIFPVHNHRYGIPSARRDLHEIRPGLWEWPVSTLPTPFGNLPFAGGVYFRVLPRMGFQAACQVLERRAEPLLFYLHPWELDSQQPRFQSSSWFLDLRHYYGLEHTAGRLEQLLRRTRFTTLEQAVARFRKTVASGCSHQAPRPDTPQGIGQMPGEETL